MLDIRLSDRYVDYKFTIWDKFTLLRGDTATGKTTLYHMFELYNQNPLNIKCAGYKNLRILPILDTHEEYENVLINRDKQVFIVDEGHPFLHTYGYEQILKASGNYFIIISRRHAFENLPIHLRSVVQLVSSGKYHTFKQLYEIPKQIEKFTSCICEDSKTGNKFISQFLPCVSTSTGKDNIANAMKDSSESLLLVYDVAGIGATYADIYTAERQREQPVTHLAWDSFESYIIDSTLYKKAPRPDYDCKYASYESYSTEVLHDVLSVYPGINYDKSGLPQCLRIERCRSCNKTAFCPYVDYSGTALLTGRLKLIVDSFSDNDSTLSSELTERIWNQMPEAIKSQYGTTKEEIVANYYKEYSHMFQ